MNVISFNLQNKQLRSRYDHLFEECPNAFIQQSTYWAEVIKDIGPDQPIFLLCHDNDRDLAGLPLYLFTYPLGNVLTSIPYPGPLGGIFFRDGLSTPIIDNIYACLLEYAMEIARGNRCLSISIITNPFFDDFHLYQRYLLPQYILENFTQYIALPEVVIEDDKILLQNYRRRSNLSRNLQQARAAEFTITKCSTDVELGALYRVHVKRHQELGVEPLAFSLFENIKRYLEPNNKSLILLVMKGDEIASGCIYIYHRNNLDVLRLNMDSKFAKQSPNYLLTEYSIRWAYQQGIQLYNWQSSPDRESGVYKFKQQWGSQEAIYYYVTKLFCEPEQIRKLGLEILKTRYAGHFIVPYLAFTEGFNKRYYKKK